MHKVNGQWILQNDAKFNCAYPTHTRNRNIVVQGVDG